jgi:hypothetical protein
MKVCKDFSVDVAMEGSAQIVTHEVSGFKDLPILKAESSNIFPVLIAEFHTARDDDISPLRTTERFKSAFVDKLLCSSEKYTEKGIYRNLWHGRIPEGADAQALLEDAFFSALNLDEIP